MNMTENLREKRKKICKFQNWNNPEFETIVCMSMQNIYNIERGSGSISQYLKYNYFLDKELEKIRRFEVIKSLEFLVKKYVGISIKVDANSNIYHITHPDIANLRFVFSNNEISIFINNCVFKDSTNLIEELKLANDIIADLSNINLH
jgi:hypothetical protein